MMLAGTSRKPDAVIRFANEHAPGEVYNGGNYFGEGDYKHEQLEDLSYDGEGTPCNPLFISRRCADDLKRAVREELNGICVETAYMLACEARRHEIEEELEVLQISDCIEFRPADETTYGEVFDGERYDGLTEDEDNVVLIHPPSTMLVNWDDVLPDDYLRRVRGGVQLQYVNSIYREGHDRTREDACFVLQGAYNILLRRGGMRRADLLDTAWEQVTNRYTRLKAGDQRREAILDSARSLLNRVLDEKMLSDRDGKLHARLADHPHPSLSF